jgi:hypothetical protein
MENGRNAGYRIAWVPIVGLDIAFSCIIYEATCFLIPDGQVLYVSGTVLAREQMGQAISLALDSF